MEVTAAVPVETITEMVQAVKIMETADRETVVIMEAEIPLREYLLFRL